MERPTDYNELSNTTTPKIKFNSSKDGLQIEVEGDISPESLSLLQELLDGKRSEKTKELEEIKIKAGIKEKVDGVVLCFAGCVFCSLVFLTQIIVTGLSQNTPSNETGFTPANSIR